MTLHRALEIQVCGHKKVSSKPPKVIWMDNTDLPWSKTCNLQLLDCGRSKADRKGTGQLPVCICATHECGAVWSWTAAWCSIPPSSRSVECRSQKGSRQRMDTVRTEPALLAAVSVSRLHHSWSLYLVPQEGTPRSWWYCWEIQHY